MPTYLSEARVTFKISSSFFPTYFSCVYHLLFFNECCLPSPPTIYLICSHLSCLVYRRTASNVSEGVPCKRGKTDRREGSHVSNRPKEISSTKGRDTRVFCLSIRLLVSRDVADVIWTERRGGKVYVANSLIRREKRAEEQATLGANIFWFGISSHGRIFSDTWMLDCLTLRGAG